MNSVLRNDSPPSYPKIKIPNTSPAHKYTQQKVTNIRIKDYSCDLTAFLHVLVYLVLRYITGMTLLKMF